MATPLPTTAAFTDGTVTEAAFKTQFGNLRTFLADLLGTDGVQATAIATLQTMFSGANNRTAGAYTLAAADKGKVIHVTGSGASAFTVPVYSTTGFGTKWVCAIRNACSTGTITLTRSSTDTIDGGTTITLDPGESCILFIADTSKWITIGKSAINGAYRSSQIFTTSGTWSKPTGLRRIKVTVVGGGGSGGLASIPGGGAGGGCAIETIEATALGSTETVTVGAGGAALTAGGAGNAGGASQFGASPHCSATGGAGGASTANVISAGGVGSGGNINLSGGDGTGSIAVDSGAIGINGSGGNSFMGTGGGGGAVSPTAGRAGHGYGAGGAGTFASGGGAGTSGIVIVEEFF